jgi:hypothetical protein
MQGFMVTIHHIIGSSPTESLVVIDPVAQIKHASSFEQKQVD